MHALVVIGCMAWHTVTAPTGGPARAVGKYAAGCIEGAARLPDTGEGWRVAQPARGRAFGHPTLVALVREVAARVKKLKLGVLSIGDLGQARGGPAPSGHASHQTGLDVDIWFAAPMVDLAKKLPSRHWTQRVARLLEVAASDARVERVFVHPVIKRALCEAGSREWLRKMRPWWGHHDHFHVRLPCPADSPDCEAQAPLPAGDGCDALAWWFDEKAQAERDQEHQSYTSKVGAVPELPERCKTLLEKPTR